MAVVPCCLPARVASLGVGMCLMIVAGVVYSIGVWGHDFTQAVGLQPEQLTTLTAAMNLGLYISPDLGLFIDKFGRQGKEWPAALLAAVGMGVGWLILWHGVASQGLPLAVGVVAFYCIGHGNFVAFAAPLRANSDNFGAQRKGLIDGVLLCGFGMSSALVSQAYTHLVGPEGLERFLQVLFCIAVGVSMLSAVFTRRINIDTNSVVGCVWPPAAWRTPSAFWRLWLVMACSGGANIWFVQSAGRLIGDAHSRAHFVLLFCLGNCSARVVGGILADKLHIAMERRGTGASPRAGRILLALPSALIMVAASAVVLHSPALPAVLSAAAAAGVSEGLLFACWPGTVRDMFGETAFSFNMSLANTALGVGTTVYLKAFGTSLTAPLQVSLVCCLVAACFAASLHYWPAVVCPALDSGHRLLT